MEKNARLTRISKYIAMCGIASRRKSEEFVLAGRIKVNGKTVDDLSYKINPGDIVECDNKIISLERNIVIALNKPPGYLSTVRDGYNRKTVIDILDDDKKKLRLYPSGRLDYNSRGLIILTNDGSLAYRLMHPGFGVPKVYRVKAEGIITQEEIKSMQKGIEIDGRDLSANRVKLKEIGIDNCIIEIEISEGRKRIIRKALAKLGHKVIDLQRVSIGKITINGIKEGSYKVLSVEEITKLQSI